jgi:hypothetical protein
MTARACPRCDAAREEASRFCARCGLDFWQAAAGNDAASAVAGGAAAQAATPTGGGLPAGTLAIVAGTLLLAGAIGLWLAFGVLAPEPRAGGPQRLTEAPSTHPLILAFFAEARDPQASFAWIQEAEVRVAGMGDALLTVASGEGRMTGDDWIATMRIEEGETLFTGDVAVVGSQAYLRTGDGGWTNGERVPGAALTSVNPFARITTVAELDYVGPVTRNGQDGHLLRTEKWLSDPELVEPIRRIAHERAREASMEIHVDPAGVPLSAVYTFSFEARTPDGEIITLEGRSTYRFSEWGAIGPIVAPTPNPNPSATPAG